MLAKHKYNSGNHKWPSNWWKKKRESGKKYFSASSCSSSSSGVFQVDHHKSEMCHCHTDCCLVLMLTYLRALLEATTRRSSCGRTLACHCHRENSSSSSSRPPPPSSSLDGTMTHFHTSVQVFLGTGTGRSTAKKQRNMTVWSCYVNYGNKKFGGCLLNC